MKSAYLLQSLSSVCYEGLNAGTELMIFNGSTDCIAEENPSVLCYQARG